MNENNSKKNRPKSQIMMPNSTSPLPPHNRKNGSSDSLPNHRYENEWEVRSKELAEAKCRVAQMEKTMRWWSDCADNWRKKWSEVKTERNDLRKELRITRTQMEKMMKQFSSGQGDSLLPTGPDHHQVSPSPKESKLNGRDSQANGFAIYCNTQAALAMSIPASSQIPYQSDSKPINYEVNNHKAQAAPGRIFPRKNAQTQTSALCSVQLSVIDKEIVSLLEEKVAYLTRKLDEVNRRFLLERDEKSRLEMTVERLRRDLSDLNELYDSLKKELADINGKEFTESEVESYAEDETEEARLIQQLAQDGNDVDDLEDDEFDAETEAELDKHTPTAETADPPCPGNSAGETASLEVVVATLNQNCSDEAEEGIILTHTQTIFQSPELLQTNEFKDLASSIQVEISEVHKKLDLKTFINDVTELVGSCPTGVMTKVDKCQTEASAQEIELGINLSAMNIVEDEHNRDVTLEMEEKSVKNSEDPEFILKENDGNSNMDASGAIKTLSPKPDQQASINSTE